MPEEASLESALGAAFGGLETPAPKLPEVPQAAPAEPEGELPEPEAEAAEEAPAEEVAEEAEAAPVEAAAEPEFEVEVDGKAETIRGADKIKETLQKGLHYTRNSEAVAREREALVANAKQQQVVQVLQQALNQDIAQLQAFDQQLEQWNRVDIGAMFESDPFRALQLKEQRDQLREARTAKFQEVQRKAGEAQAALQTASNERLAAEEQALLAKLPEWRNSERAKTEVSKITSWLQSQGYSKAEADAVGDHRHMLVARKAYLYDQLMAQKDAKVKQVRAAPQMVRPGATPAQPNGRVEFNKARAKIKELGTKGNHRAQENIAERMFERAFK